MGLSILRNKRLGFAWLSLAALAAQPAAAQFSLLAGGPASFAPLVRMVAPSVVGIAVTEGSGQAANPVPELPRGQSEKSIKPVVPVAQAAGSGFVARSDGMIITNNHVIEGATSIMVTLDDGERYPAQVVGRDELTDLAVVKITPRHPLTAAHWGNANAVQVGDWVLVAGNPFALGNSFTAGIVSAEGRDIGDGPFDHFLQLDAPINPGNSGGPAFNMSGEVVGVNTAIVSPSGGSVGIGFAIPSNTARKIIAAIIAHGNVPRGWLGVTVADLPDSAAGPAKGAGITAVEADSPAYKAGLTPGDIVKTVDGATVAGSTDLIRDIASMAPGSKVTLGISRNGHILTLPVVVDRRPAQLGE
jgi:serine protease Do